MNLVYYFTVFSVIGWIIEVVYRSWNNRQLVNPGFLKGFYLPLYGFGALLILAGHTLLAPSILPVRAIVYFVALAALELAAGAAIEKIFRTRLWDYSDQHFNTGGHICLQFAIYWMLLATGLDLSLDFLIPRALALHEWLHPVSGIVLGAVALSMSIDFIVSLQGKLKQRSCRPFDNEALKREFTEIAGPLLKHPDVVKLKDCNHHFGKTRLDHVLDVAWMAFRKAKHSSLDCNAVVRGALLHDLFYYDWLREGPNWHGIRHPRIALQNAQKVTSLSEKERDIITKHMWPITIVPPGYPESWAVCFSDLSCSLRDYLVPAALALIGKRKAWTRTAGTTFPSYAALKKKHMTSRESIAPLPGTGRAERSLDILLIDAQPRAIPFSVLRTLTLPRVAGATPTKHRVRIIDGRMETIRIPARGIDLVGITFSCNNAPLAYDIAEKAKELGIMTVAGGPHATAVPDEVLKHFDSVLTGEAEGGAWEDLLKDAEECSLKRRYSNARPPDLGSLKPPRLDLLRSRLYLPVYPVEATRGCPNKCSFCFNRYIHPMYRKRPVSHVVADIECSDHNTIFFMDDNLTVDSKYAKELFKALRPLKKRLYFQMQLSAAEDEELVLLAADAGCRAIFTGIESINAMSLDSVSKSFNNVERYKEQISILDRHGITVTCGLIFGLDADNRDVFQHTKEFLGRSGITSVAVNLAIPYPGTDFYARMKDEGRLLNLDYANYTGYRPLVAPKRMTPEELERGYEKFIDEIYSSSNVISRFRNQHRPLRQLPMFAAANLAFRLPRRAKSRSLWG